jgi:hypothetical protein
MMSKPRGGYDLGVWSEIEGGDWEACVISSYLEGLVYGGVTSFPLGVYTQAEREALELIPDEPQDYNTTDGRALARYGVQLRKLSTGSLADAVTRVGVGLVLAGYGDLFIPSGATIHSVFYLPTSPTAGLLYDPLAAGPNDAREVRDNEFGITEATDMQLKGTNPRPLAEGSLVTITAGGYLVADPTAMPYTNLATLNQGAPLNVDWQVTANEILGVREWYGAWVFTDPPQFGYASLGLCGPLESTIEPPEPEPEPPPPILAGATLAGVGALLAGLGVLLAGVAALILGAMPAA